MAQHDEQAIRALFSSWLRATVESDVDRVLSLMADDVIFLQPGQPPMRGKAAFAAASKSMPPGMRIEPQGELLEVMVEGNLAYCWAHLSVTITPPPGKPMRRSGYTLTVFRKQVDGRWLLIRDANMLSLEITKL
jgi:uncharacterized protein (TIGR02246 family)